MKKNNHKKNINKLVAALIIIFIVVVGTSLVLRTIYPVKYTVEIISYSQEYNINPYLVISIIKAESGFDRYAKSHRDARGLMQLTEQTAKWAAESVGITNFSIEDLYNPETNIKLGCWYLNQLFNEFDSNTKLVLAAYNGGSGNVRKWLEQKSLSSTGKELDKIPFKETESYVKKVTTSKTVYEILYPRLF